jgi:hypothetical protein
MSNYEDIYSRDFKTDGISHGWIEWKGTNVCMDIHCVCGKHSHMDADFFYYFECSCGKMYAVGSNVKMIELNEEEIEYAKKRIGFMKESKAKVKAWGTKDPYVARFIAKQFNAIADELEKKNVRPET